MSKAYPCVYCTDDLKCTKFTDDEATSFCVLGPCHDEKPSRGDQIRAKTDEQFAEWIESLVYCYSCPFHNKECQGGGFVSRASCKLHWLEWLRKEADNSD